MTFATGDNLYRFMRPRHVNLFYFAADISHVNPNICQGYSTAILKYDAAKYLIVKVVFWKKRISEIGRIPDFVVEEAAPEQQGNSGCDGRDNFGPFGPSPYPLV